MNFKALLIVVLALCLQVSTVSAVNPIVENANAVWISNSGYEKSIAATTAVNGTDVIVSLGHISEDETLIVNASSGAALPWGFQIRKGEDLIVVNDWWGWWEHETRIPGYAYGAGDYYLVLTTGGIGLNIDIKPFFGGFESLIPGASIAYVDISMPPTEWNIGIDKISTPAPEKIGENFSGCNVLLYIGCFSSGDTSVTVKADSGAWLPWKMQVWEESIEEANVTHEWYNWGTHETEINGPGNYYLHLSTGNLTLETSLPIYITVEGVPVAVVSINPSTTVGLPATAWNVTIEYSLSETKDILVKDANAVWRSSLNTTPAELNDAASTALPRPLIDYPNTAFNFELKECPEELTDNASKALPRPLVEYPNTVFSFPLEESPENLNNTARKTLPRPLVEYPNTVLSKSLIFPKELINDTTPPIITNITITNITDNSATIKWDTDEIANSLVKYGVASGVYTESEEDSLFVKNHIVELTGLSAGTCYYFVANSTDQSGNSAESSEYSFTTSGVLKVFDTDSPANPYPSIMGNHTGTITPSCNISVSKLYTYPCEGTGGHTEYAKICNASWSIETLPWNGYKGDWHNLSFSEPFKLYPNVEYNYTIRTGSYPQIHHNTSLLTTNGWINCTSFVDANGKKYDNWIPAIRLE